MAYTRGNLAVKEKASQQRVTQQRYKETTKVVTRRTGLPAREKFLYLLTLLAVIVVGGLMMSRYAQIYDLNKQAQSTLSEVREAEKTIADLQVEREKLNNLVIEHARELGYVEATDKNVIYVPRSTNAGSSSDTAK
ncbi:hypothetical protein ASD24_06240 [Paenibacillus sp. Root52]|uniref:Cell division protein FtsL n=1 Tax=Paenibacillus amylolyticus TaxID=1451 RepID=A0AAP5LQ59_PAEAM|nr:MULTISPECIES: hypothetical protein [Paenibacillus]KQY87456.1 hypothetical protein ASD24_06240 [Paenibacillus sp. Root52]MCG7375919.1 hypothetical protein [Paenibacillus sp. ACRSA]MDR6725405.1 cell division protein FtsL [Paenibacillus amylolyticus]